MKKLFVVTFAVFVQFACFGQRAMEKSIQVGNTIRTYLATVPRSVPAENRALIIGLHGGGSNAKNMEYTMHWQSEQYGFVQFYPDGVQNTWNVEGVPTGSNFVPKVDDVAFISALIDEAVKNYKVNPDKVYLVGASRGGMMALYYMTKMSSKITAVSAIISSMPKQYENFALEKKVGLLVINGTEDPLISYNGVVDIKPTDKPAEIEKKNAGALMPTEAFVQKMALLNNGETTPTITPLPNNNNKDNCSAQVYTYPNQDPKGLVMLIKVVGGGHVVPGGNQYLPVAVIGNACKDFSGFEKTYDFFKSFHN